MFYTITVVQKLLIQKHDKPDPKGPVGLGTCSARCHRTGKCHCLHCNRFVRALLRLILICPKSLQLCRQRATYSLQKAEQRESLLLKIKSECQPQPPL